ncbi:P-loop containing nucleoside triphosphate hydrolase protein [Xylariaceae sp. FL0594]|nr:P-loop containing nucleoside triphosphate hydrolase protein [Xylariaceae sp. FL0594]
MTIIEKDEVSDGEFDMVDSAYTVSNVSTPSDGNIQPQHLPGGHYGPAFDGGQIPDPEVQACPLPDIRPTDNIESVNYGEQRAYGLGYRKSVVRKFWPGQDLLIAVMGMTGSGKTTFISKVTGRKDLNIGHSLTSCTRDIEVIETEIDGRVVRFVDTPGFSDTTMSDTDVLHLIAEYLVVAYKNEMKLSGIIYLHPISDTRVTHHATKNLEMFRKLTGEANLKNVMLATSMWDKVSPKEGQAREEELKNKFWKLLLAYEAKAIRYGGTPESARYIAQQLMANKPFYVQIQQEMGKENKAVKDTEAGRQVMIELVRLKEEHQRELADMEAALKSTAKENKMAVEALSEHYQEMLSALQKTLADERRMNEEAVRSLKARIEALESQRSCSVM